MRCETVSPESCSGVFIYQTMFISQSFIEVELEKRYYLYKLLNTIGYTLTTRKFYTDYYNSLSY